MRDATEGQPLLKLVESLKGQREADGNSSATDKSVVETFFNLLDQVQRIRLHIEVLGAITPLEKYKDIAVENAASPFFQKTQEFLKHCSEKNDDQAITDFFNTDIAVNLLKGLPALAEAECYKQDKQRISTRIKQKLQDNSSLCADDQSFYTWLLIHFDDLHKTQEGFIEQADALTSSDVTSPRSALSAKAPNPLKAAWQADRIARPLTDADKVFIFEQFQAMLGGDAFQNHSDITQSVLRYMNEDIFNPSSDEFIKLSSRFLTSSSDIENAETLFNERVSELEAQLKREQVQRPLNTEDQAIALAYFKEKIIAFTAFAEKSLSPNFSPEVKRERLNLIKRWSILSGQVSKITEGQVSKITEALLSFNGKIVNQGSGLALSGSFPFSSLDSSQAKDAIKDLDALYSSFGFFVKTPLERMKTAVANFKHFESLLSSGQCYILDGISRYLHASDPPLVLSVSEEEQLKLADNFVSWCAELTAVLTDLSKGDQLSALFEEGVFKRMCQLVYDAEMSVQYNHERKNKNDLWSNFSLSALDRMQIALQDIDEGEWAYATIKNPKLTEIKSFLESGPSIFEGVSLEEQHKLAGDFSAWCASLPLSLNRDISNNTAATFDAPVFQQMCAIVKARKFIPVDEFEAKAQEETLPVENVQHAAENEKMGILVHTLSPKTDDAIRKLYLQNLKEKGDLTGDFVLEALNYVNSCKASLSTKKQVASLVVRSLIPYIDDIKELTKLAAVTEAPANAASYRFLREERDFFRYVFSNDEAKYGNTTTWSTVLGCIKDRLVELTKETPDVKQDAGLDDQAYGRFFRLMTTHRNRLHRGEAARAEGLAQPTPAASV